MTVRFSNLSLIMALVLVLLWISSVLKTWSLLVLLALLVLVGSRGSGIKPVRPARLQGKLKRIGAGKEVISMRGRRRYGRRRVIVRRRRSRVGRIGYRM